MGAPLSATQSAKLHADVFENEFGRMAQLEVDGTLYDPAKGGLFLAALNGTRVEVLRLDADLSKVTPDNKGLEALAGERPEIAAFFARCRAGRTPQ